MKEKLKIVWLCHFTNAEVQIQLKPYKKTQEIAPWISYLLPVFENNDAVELHVLAQHEYIRCYRSFQHKGIFYHFVPKGIPLIGRHWPRFFRFDLWTNYYFWKKKVAGIVKKINPHIIHLQGAENEFCAAILQFQHKIPVFITIQGFIGKSSSTSSAAKNRKRNEIRIIQAFKHYGIRTQTMGKDVQAMNPNAVLYWHNYPMQAIEPFDNVQKRFDLVFFARMTKDKGIHDLLQAVATIKKTKENIQLCAIGGGNIEEFKQLTEELGISNNVYWAGFLPTQRDVHQLASAARISVLPTYHDIIPGTIIESLFLNIPVVAYNVGSIHEVNEKEDIISLVDKLDVNGLANAIEHLLDNPEKRKEIAEKGHQRAVEMFMHSDEEVKMSLLNAYRKIINDFKPEKKEN